MEAAKNCFCDAIMRVCNCYFNACIQNEYPDYPSLNKRMVAGY